jgi:hypothetical protein
MRNIVYFILTGTFLCSHFALGDLAKKHTNLVSEGVGILTKAELDEEENKAGSLPFPPNDSGQNFNYWQCLRPEGYFLGCENEGKPTGENWEIGSVTFWIKANGKKYDFGTRRNWDIGACRDMISEILKIMETQPIVCVSASYGKNQEGEYWIIDRVKTKKGEWSWFGR